MGTFNARKTTEQFIAEAKAIHGDKYDYSRVEYKTNKDKVCIICSVHGEFGQRPIDHLSGSGCLKCARLEHVPTFGISASIYKKWWGMKNRCSPVQWSTKYKTYKGCTFFQEWSDFKNFERWAMLPENGYREDYHLDKDILIKGNKVYSPETCCFVPQDINSLFTSCRKKRGLYPIGVTKSRNTYLVHLSCRGYQSCIGSYKTQEEAFLAYKDAKERYIKEIAETYFQEGKITKKVYDALMKYEVEITD